MFWAFETLQILVTADRSIPFPYQSAQWMWLLHHEGLTLCCSDTAGPQALNWSTGTLLLPLACLFPNCKKSRQTVIFSTKLSLGDNTLKLPIEMVCCFLKSVQFLMSDHLYLLRTKVIFLELNYAATFNAHMYTLLRITSRGSACTKQGSQHSLSRGQLFVPGFIIQWYYGFLCVFIFMITRSAEDGSVSTHTVLHPYLS